MDQYFIEQYLVQSEAVFRLGAFALILLIMLLWQASNPKRAPQLGWVRRLNNLALISLDVVLVRYLIPISTAVMAEIAATHGWGLFNVIQLGFWPAVFLSILFMDLVIYGQHVVTHYVPLLWRMHRVHHTDRDLDVTTALRFHPFEIIFSAILKLFFITLIGAPVVAVIIFEIVLNISSMFNHSNVQIPARLDRVLRYFIVTPDMHRVHHSMIKQETNSNYGFNIPWWDYIFGTYRAQPEAGHQKMDIGLVEFKVDEVVYLHHLLMQPFVCVKKKKEASEHEP